MEDIELAGSSAADGTSAQPVEPSHSTDTAYDGTAARWVRAILVRSGNGVRSADVCAGVQLVCDTGMYSLDASLQQGSLPGWFVMGQLFLRRNNAPAESVEVVLCVDEKPVEKARTDAFGEFAFPSRAGRRIGVALNGPELAHVELWRVD